MTFWQNSLEFFESLRKYVAKWPDGAKTIDREPRAYPAKQSHSEWASMTSMSHSGTEASLDFFHLSTAGLARYARQQSTDAVRSSSRATAPTVLPSSSTSLTAPSLNSSENCRRARRPSASFDMRDIVSTFRKMSTKSDQAQTAQSRRCAAGALYDP